MKAPEFFYHTTFKKSQETFDIYKIKGFDFEDNLDFPENQKGVYIFANRYRKDIDETWYRIYYVGRTKNLRKRFYHHHKSEDLTEGDTFNVLCVHPCKTIIETKELEERLIKLYKPRYNAKLNPEYQD